MENKTKIIGRNIRKLEPYNLIEEIENSPLYQRVFNPSTEIDESIIQITTSAKIYKLTEKGFELVRKRFEFFK